MNPVIFTVAQDGGYYKIVMTIISNQYVIDTAKTLEEATEKAAKLNKTFVRGTIENKSEKEKQK